MSVLHQTSRAKLGQKKPWPSLCKEESRLSHSLLRQPEASDVPKSGLSSLLKSRLKRGLSKLSSERRQGRNG